MKKWTHNNQKYQRIVLNKNQRWKNKKNQQKKRKSQIQFLSILAPTYFSVTSQYHRQNLVKFTNKIDRVIQTGDRGVSIDFSDTEKMFVDGALFFLARISRTKQKSRLSSKFRCQLGENSKVNQVLKQVGILDILNCTRKISPADDDVVHWQVAMGNNVLGEKFDTVLGKYDGRIAESLSKNLYDGITEAMTNTKKHAYLNLDTGEMDNPEAQTPWWMLSQERDGWLSVCFVDLGVGIPATLKKTEKGKTIIKDLVRIVQKPNHGDMIKEAALRSNSRTQQKHRGKGLPQMASILEGINDSVLYIMSSKGIYKRTDNGEGESMTCHTVLPGTLIFWKVPIGGEV